MQHKFWLGILLGGVLGLLLLSMVSAALADATATTYDLSWNTISGGGASFTTVGNYSLGGTIGQNAAGPLNGGSDTLNSGFWQSQNFGVYLPIVLK